VKAITRSIKSWIKIAPRQRVSFAIPVIIACFASPPWAQAVSPPPDGGYPNFTTAEGQNALLNLTTGSGNTAVGSFSLESLTGGSFNTGIGAGTLVLNTGDSNTATGAAALLLNTTGANNTANGTAALVNNSTVEDNTAVGAFALNSNTASSNTAIGSNALLSNTTGANNTATGLSALGGNETGGNNTAIGSMALRGNSTGSSNTAVGDDALRSPVGETGSGNTAVGHSALLGPFGGPGDNNTAVGAGAGGSLGEFDTNNIDIGFGVAGGPGDSNTIRIGNEDITATFIKGISGATVVSGATVLVGANGHLGTATSSKRFKEEIKPMDKASEALFSLKPVTFRYKKELDPVGTQQFGLVAEDVEKISADLVARDENGVVNTVRYDQVNAMLLNEFLKEHRKVQRQSGMLENQARKIRDQETTIAELKKEMETVVVMLKEQESQIQGFSAQIEMSKPATSVVLNNP
jgi:Chaperone of endosialidase